MLYLARRGDGHGRRLPAPGAVRGERIVSDDEPETVEGEVVSDGPDGVEALPGLAALAARRGAEDRRVVARAYGVRAGARLLQVAARPQTAPELINDVRRGVRDLARELTGMEDIEDRIADVMPDQVVDRWPALPPPSRARQRARGATRSPSAATSCCAAPPTSATRRTRTPPTSGSSPSSRPTRAASCA